MTNKKQSIVAIVPAAGIGQRMQTSLPKQYIEINGQSILEHTLNKLFKINYIEKIIVVINPNDHYFSTLSIASHPKINVTFGGETRAESVLAGLNFLENLNHKKQNEYWALVHDAARPCVEVSDIEHLINTVLEHNQGGILAIKITDTVKKMTAKNLTPKIEKTLNRALLWAAATPQMFPSNQLIECLQQALINHIDITDEASAIEYFGGKPLLIECKRNNIKITCSEDLPLAELYLQIQQKNVL